jgi:hypothetical protein
VTSISRLLPLPVVCPIEAAYPAAAHVKLPEVVVSTVTVLVVTPPVNKFAVAAVVKSFTATGFTRSNDWLGSLK